MEPDNCEGIIHGRQKMSSDDITLPPSEDEDDSEIMELFPALSKIRHEYCALDEDFVLDERVDCTGGLVIGATVHVNFDSEGDGGNSSGPPRLSRLRRPLVLTSLSGRRVTSPYYGPFVLSGGLCSPEVLLPRDRDWSRRGFGSQPVLERPRHVLDSAPRAASQPAKLTLLSGQAGRIKQDAGCELLPSSTPPLAEPTALLFPCYPDGHDYAMLDVQSVVDATSPSSSSGGSCLTPDSLEHAAVGARDARDAHPDSYCQLGELSNLSQDSAQGGKGEDKAGVSALVPISGAQQESAPSIFEQAEQRVPDRISAIGAEQQVPSVHMRAIAEPPTVTTWKDIARRERAASGGNRDDPFPLLEPADLFEDALMSSGSPFTPARDPCLPCLSGESARDLFATLGDPRDSLTKLLDDNDSQKLALEGILSEIIDLEFQQRFDEPLDSSQYVTPDACGAQGASSEVNTDIPQIDDLEREFRERFPNYGRHDFVQDSDHLVGKASTRPQGREGSSESDHNSPYQCGDHMKNAASSLSPKERADLSGDIAAVDTLSNATDGKGTEDDDSVHCAELTKTNKAYLDDTGGPDSDILRNRASLDDTSSPVSNIGKAEASLDVDDTCSSGGDFLERATDISSGTHQDDEEGSSLWPSDRNAPVHSSANSGSQHSKTENSDGDVISSRDSTQCTPAGIEEDPFEGCSSPPSPSRDLDALYLTQPSATKRVHNRADKPLYGESVPKRARTSWDQWFKQFKNIVAAGREKKLLSSETHVESDETEQHEDSQRVFPHRKSDQEVPDSGSATEKFEECRSPGCGCTTAATVVRHRRPLFQWTAAEPHTKDGGPAVVKEYYHPEDKRSATSETRCSIRLGLSRRARPPPLHKRLQWWVSRVLCSLQ